MKILTIVGARPNFMKAAPLLGCLRRRGHQPLLVHTGQHYDANMSDAFFRDLGLPTPDRHLGIGSGSHAQQTARIIAAFEPVVLELAPDLVVVVGDVNSTLACTLVCSKLGIPVAHVEAGLRSRDRTMPEEINRLVTDCLADLLLTPSPDGDENLRAEGVPAEKIHHVGNIMIDSLVQHLDAARRCDVVARLALPASGYGVVTLHRPSNVDDPATLAGILGALREISRDLPLVFPCHPRTAGQLDRAGGAAGLKVIEPLGYIEFLALVANSKLVLTDSGGLQEETTYHRIPCLTIRDNTERPITITQGSNVLAGTDPRRLVTLAREALAQPRQSRPVPALWDGKTADRIVDVLEQWWRSRSAG
ncbi:MAG: UDP-N-acetylglucosamine 2-epimerase (non-hydrolyzing) [Planctomycetes bacterium]|nr:UDP-N-acetylglucosamine 2-epimerase (non-hydrolyzing) [Planctomycetota bacterium]MCC7398284.1 UDP-N-acetylglucosamine 2-epimerase (non-hydrolyzing) [Planctomycetota bacterium]